MLGCAACAYDCSDLDARADLDSDSRTYLDTCANMDAGTDLHAYTCADMDAGANADSYGHSNAYRNCNSHTDS